MHRWQLSRTASCSLADDNDDAKSPLEIVIMTWFSTFKLLLLFLFGWLIDLDVRARSKGGGRNNTVDRENQLYDCCYIFWPADGSSGPLGVTAWWPGGTARPWRHVAVGSGGRDSACSDRMVPFALESDWAVPFGRYFPYYRPALVLVGGSALSLLIGPFKFKFDCLNMNLVV
jgi:hypothetical protein